MFWCKIHRMILIELVKIFSVALVALTSLILLAGIIAEAMKCGLGPAQILMALPLLLPSMLPFTVPATTLFATSIVYGRLSKDNEILALKAAGIHIIHVIWPALLLGAGAGAVTMFLYLDAIPHTHFLLKSQVAGDVEELLFNMLRKDGYIKHPKINYEIYVKRVQGRKLLDAQFMRRAADGRSFDAIVRSKEADLVVDILHKQMIFHIRQGHLVQKGGTLGLVQDCDWPVDLPAELSGDFIKARATDMTWRELGEYEQLWLRQKEKISREIDGHQSAINRGRAPPHFQDHVSRLVLDRKNLDYQLFSLQNERHMRPAFALGCLCFALVGCPVGIWISKSDYLSAFITCFLPIVTIYYPLMFCMINLTRSGKFPPWLAIYNADGLMFIAAVVLFRRLTRT